jgi:arylsulfatase A-like enzyme
MASFCLILLAIFFSVWPSNSLLARQAETVRDDRPNILFAIADDWGWPHAGVYGDPVVKTPTFDRIANEGVLFENAFVSSPSCTPSRNAILTGQYHWRLGWGGNLWSKLDTKHQTYPHLLEASGYYTGHYRKSWGPGKLDNWDKHPAGPRFESVDSFFDKWPRNRPFCFWFGTSDPHRPYKAGTGVADGMDLAKIRLFGHFPDCDTIRSDVADYYLEVQRFDRELGAVLDKLESMGELENTIVVMTGDHGMPFPRCKANLYDCGTHVPMAVRWPRVVKPGRKVTDFVSTTDLAPTFLESAGVAIPEAMTGKSWLKIFQSDQSGRIESRRDHVVTGKERHVPAQAAPDPGGTPMRAIRTDDFLLIRNFTPERWPAGTPDWENAYIRGCWYGDCDNGPTKSYMVENQNKDAAHRRAYELSFGKRPEFELYDLKTDPDQLNNVAAAAEYSQIVNDLNQRLTGILEATNDPRILGKGPQVFDQTEYFGQGPRHPDSIEK